ncbi:MAG TPA: pyridoxal-phosphate dependent enzyme [Thermoanaerobaculia bacterium]|nr:pyridoxal-phosphate dependent enzyme [Thermoanaerobaculia bacterium]
MSIELQQPVPFSLREVREARERIASTIVRTPLVRLNVDQPRDIYLKLENLQPINAFKIRGAANAVALLPEESRHLGVWTISAGNAGQGVAYAARKAGIPCTVVVIDTAPDTKVERMAQLGARLIKAPFDVCWSAMGSRDFPGVEGTFIHPFDDHDFIVGNATMALEIFEDLPEVRSIVASIGGGGLIAGVGGAARLLNPAVKIWGAEPETAAPASLSFTSKAPEVFSQWTASFVDGAGGKSMFPRMWERISQVVDGSIVVTLDEIRNAMRLVAEKNRVIAEGAGALAVAAALSGKAGEGPVVAVISGGNIDLRRFAELIGVAILPA